MEGETATASQQSVIVMGFQYIGFVTYEICTHFNTFVLPTLQTIPALCPRNFHSCFFKKMFIPSV